MSKGRQIKTDARGRIDFLVSSGFGGNTRQPFVEIEVGDQSTQISPEAARALALNLLQAAEAAEMDGMLVSFAQTALDLDLEGAGKLLRLFRHQRDARHGKEADSA